MNPRIALLRIKIKSLAYEQRCIRREHHRAKKSAKYHRGHVQPDRLQDQYASLIDEMDHHRKTVVRKELRRTLVAYQLLRGKRIPLQNDDYSAVIGMIRRYGDRQDRIRLLGPHGSAPAAVTLAAFNDVVQHLAAATSSPEVAAAA